MKVVKTELAKDGYEKIEDKIQKIETLARDGVLSDKFDIRITVSRFQRIISETKNLRQVLREVFVFVPAGVSQKGEGDAA
ncbi:MAG: hypothetical protein LBI04_08625 [Treponema sp.]|jgi:hypothetical protein|nr:hypothetical protein [Treponema sp.]